MSQDRRLMDHQLDRLERILQKCVEADRQLRRERRAELRAQKEKLKPPDELDAQSGNDGKES